MSLELTITAKRQITPRRAPLEHLHIRPGQCVVTLSREAVERGEGSLSVILFVVFFW